MDATLLGQVAFNSLMLGATYALVAIGLSLVFSIMRVIQFAHGSIYMLGGYALYLQVTSWGINYFLALLVSAFVIGVLGVVIERVFLRPLRGQDLPSMIVTLGLLLLLEGSAMLIFGERDKRLQSPVSGIISFFDVVLPVERLLIAALAVPLILLVFFFVRQVKEGQAMWAIAQDSEAALLQGINVNRISALGMFIGSALAAIASGLLLPIQVLTPAVGGPVVIKAFMVVILGGLGSIPGAVVGSMAFGFIESFGVQFFGGYSSLAAFLAVMLILIFRPQGLVGRV